MTENPAPPASSLNNLPASVSAGEVARRNEKLWNTPRAIEPPPTVQSAPEPPSVLSLPESASLTELRIPSVRAQNLGAADQGSPVSTLPTTITQQELAATCLEHGDGVTWRK